jgi:hypothetical protein
MILLKVTLPRYAKVLLLEDSEMRIQWFEQKVPGIKVVRSVEEFKEYFDTHPTVDFIFFDHDLGEGGSGYEAAQFMAERFGATNRWGLIHSWNRTGAARMQQILEATPAVPFGEFDIEIVGKSEVIH